MIVGKFDAETRDKAENRYMVRSIHKPKTPFILTTRTFVDWDGYDNPVVRFEPTNQEIGEVDITMYDIFDKKEQVVIVEEFGQWHPKFYEYIALFKRLNSIHQTEEKLYNMQINELKNGS